MGSDDIGPFLNGNIAVNTLVLSNGVMIDIAQLVTIVSNQQQIHCPDELNELQHLLNGRPSSLLLILRDGSKVQIDAGNCELKIERRLP